MTDTKRWYQSKTFWAQALGIVVLLADQIGVTPMPPEDSTAETIAVVTNVLGILFRLVARRRLTL